ncbi:SAM-dependent chlorinase/fluorinase [SAR202 cluster bacterium AC-647-N09_OGT_505m]|nr:SAM-dependent chlorinase/fluorinase [SAR202 cluster bacterium AC-647-N09_OGT_505m]
MITLTTDFGTRDSYVAEMKGMILQINPQATIVDISHHIDSQSVIHGAFVLGSTYHYFPRDTIHVAVVDPGVGTSRRAVLMVTPKGSFLAPDNGVLTYVLRGSPGYLTTSQDQPFLEPMEVAIPSGYSAYQLSNHALWKSPISDTFHGRDVFAPVAAHLSLGVAPEEVGEPLHSLVCLCIPNPRWQNNTLTGHIIHVDGFGNLITTIEGQTLAQNRVDVLLGGHRIQGVSRSYVEGADLLAIIGSHGNLEIAVRDGSAARELSANVGEEVVVELLPLG